MGYTNYWSRPRQLDKRKWAGFIADLTLLLTKLPKKTDGRGPFKFEEKPREIRLLGYENNFTSKPHLTPEMVRFNGRGRTKKDNYGHETFLIKRVVEPSDYCKPQQNMFVDFCKTARKPYDLVVKATLIILAYHFPQVTASCDCAEGEDFIHFQPAWELVKSVFPDRVFRPT